MNNLINFKRWLEEQTAAAAGPASTSSSVSATAGPAAGSAITGATLSGDIAKVPMRLGCGKDCGKDFFKNWHYKKKRKK